MNLNSESVSGHEKDVSPIARAGHPARGLRSGTDKQAVAFFTHVFNPAIELRYRKLKEELGSRAQIFIFAPLGTSVPHQYLDETYFFDYDSLRSGAVRVNGDKIIPGNVHLAQLDFYRHHPGFDYYWFIEYDVVFTGDWATLLAAVENDPADLLAAHVRSLEEEPAWPWWETLELPGCSLSQAEWLRAFFPVYRISNDGLRSVDEHVKLGWSGHFEGLIPCIIRAASLSISDLGGSGRWTPQDRRHRFYSSFSSDAGVSLNAGTHRHRPPLQLPLVRRNTIFHPVKAGSAEQKKGVVEFVKHQYLRELPVRCAISLYYNLLSLWPLPHKTEKSIKESTDVG
ncbi:DUF3405 domain-containing protein [Bradyrhizobium canariense]|uniref:DUF3405 domain-containing protein n=1 Tax=Bradyrhizobium canariense TaxID=255045 RepID=UPI00142F8956|nr:DUF3405 domain-containing protein [Bradyrhizobium canariense]